MPLDDRATQLIAHTRLVKWPQSTPSTFTSQPANQSAAAPEHPRPQHPPVYAPSTQPASPNPLSTTHLSRLSLSPSPQSLVSDSLPPPSSRLRKPSASAARPFDVAGSLLARHRHTNRDTSSSPGRLRECLPEHQSPASPSPGHVYRPRRLLTSSLSPSTRCTHITLIFDTLDAVAARWP